jgi:dihydropyrimidine dehydrogenase (NAD+) subunit PreA
MQKCEYPTKHLTWDERTKANNIPTTFNDELVGGRHHWVPSPADALKNKRKDMKR